MTIVLAEMIVLPILVLTFWVLAYRSQPSAGRQVLSSITLTHAARDRVGGLHRCQRAVPPFLL